MSARPVEIREQRGKGWQRSEITASEWLLRLSPREQVAAAAALEPGLALVRDLAPGDDGQPGGEALCIRAEVATGPEDKGSGAGCEERIESMRERLARAARRGALRPAPLPNAPDDDARTALAEACAQLETDPAAAAAELDATLRGFPIYPRDDGSFRVALDARDGLPFIELRATADGGCALAVDLTEIGSAPSECADAAALAALRGAATARGVGALAHSDGVVLALSVGLDAPIEAGRVGLALCALEQAAIACARECALLACDPDLARAYLALGSTSPLVGAAPAKD